jgi:diaminopimelate epimerase
VTCENGRVHLTKHEGAGNDFLVVLDPDDTLRPTGAQIRLLCDRHRGIGADGIIRVGPGRDGAHVSMQLHNADGGEAEMSGNGIRCLAQAAVEAGLVTPPTFLVATAAGVRTVTFAAAEEPGRARASVDMGAVTLGPELAPIDGRTARTADVGNPHLVLIGPGIAGVDVGRRGPELAGGYADGVNVEWIQLGADPDGALLELRVFERGAGETLACGTGSVAAAAVARAAGLVGGGDGGGPIRVRNPGGTLEVTLSTTTGTAGTTGTPTPTADAILAGPVRKVADIDVHPGMLS